MKKLSIIILILLWTSLVHSQTNKHISRNEAVTLIEQLSAQIAELYVLQNKTEKIDTQLNNYLQNIDNSAPLEIEKFIESVNQVLYHSSNDHHLKLIYNPDKYEAYQKGGEQATDSLNREISRKVNFGVQKVEILTNNIGLLRFNKFQNRDHVESVIQGAMLMLANSDAVIIDLRYNGGGDGRTKELLETYFMSKEQFFSRSIQEFISETEFDSLKNATPSCQRLETVPLYILTSNGTFSAAEGFCYDLKEKDRAQIIGTKTKGGGHSGSSIPLSNGFLAFIPDNGKNSPVEGVGISPDIETPQSQALLIAQKEIINKFMNASSDSSLQAEYQWSIQTLESELANSSINEEVVKDYLGEYSGGFKVDFIGTELFISQEKNKMKSKLLPIDGSYYVLFDNTDFGKGNYRIRFLGNGSAQLEVNLGVKIAKMEIEKAN